MFLDDYRVLDPYVDAESFDLSSASLWASQILLLITFLSISCRSLNIRGIGIERKFRWTAFGRHPS
jgi:hypothetical protein